MNGALSTIAPKQVLSISWRSSRSGKGVQLLESLASRVKAAAFCAPGCKPANRVRTQVRTFCVATIPHRPAMTGLSAHWPTHPGANRKPCKPHFLVGRWRNSALAPPVLEYRQEGPLLPRAYVRASTITIGSDHHHRHNHHGRWPGVTVVMVVTVATYCLHRRTRRYARRSDRHTASGSCIHAGISRCPCSTRQTSIWSGRST